MKGKRRLAAVSLAATCALSGAAAGISQSSAAKSKAATTTTRPAAAAFPGRGHGGPGGPGGRPVHAVEAVLNKAGSAYISETEDNGTVTALDTSAGTVTLKEGTSTVTYGTPTIAIPSGATVTLDGASSSLEKLATGDHVSIVSSSDGTSVFATDASFAPGNGAGHMGGPPPAGQAPEGATTTG